MDGLRNSCLQLLFSSKPFVDDVTSNNHGQLHKNLAKILKLLRHSPTPNWSLQSVARFPQEVNQFVQELWEVQPRTVQCETSGDVALFLTYLLEAIHLESNRANPDLINPRFVATSAFQAINYELEFVHNSRLAHQMLVQTQTESTCNKCQASYTKWNVEWMIQLDLGGSANRNAPLEALAGTKTSLSCCETCKQECDKKQSITRAGKMVLVNIGGSNPGTRATLPDTANLYSMTLCALHFEVSSAVLLDKSSINGVNDRWFSLVRTSTDTWYKIDGLEVLPQSHEEAKKSLAKFGILLAFDQKDLPFDQIPSVPSAADPSDDTVMTFPALDDE